MNKKKAIIISIITIALLIGGSFAYWMLNLSQTTTNNIATSCFNISLAENNAINLQNAFPMRDSEGASLTPYEFTITNNCSTYAYYEVNLEVLNSTNLNSEYIKIKLDDENPSLLSDKTTTTTTLSNAISSHRLKTAYLHASESKTYNLRLWLDENVTLSDNITEKEFYGKITIRVTYKPDEPTQMEECEAQYGEGAGVCNYITKADPANNKCLEVDENGLIDIFSNEMGDDENPIVCTTEDEYGTTYYLRGLHTTNNIKFANSCWKLTRVTGTGGLKLIYNGDLDVNGKCTKTNDQHIGFEAQTLNLLGDKVYGNSYIQEGTTYTLTDTSTLNWSNDSASIIGKYTCGNTSTSCENPYFVTSIEDDTTGNVLKMGISTNYAQIGTSAFNTNANSASYVGYMYNDVYSYQEKKLYNNTNNYYYGESFDYNNGTYTLNNTVHFADVSNSTNKTLLDTHHYTCFNTSNNTCTKLYYIYFLNNTTLDYIRINGNETGPDALNKMIGNNDINVKDSSIKKFIDGWYILNLKDKEYEKYLEDTIFCNDRTITDLGGWAENGVVSGTSWLSFNGRRRFYYIKCPNKRDAFTVSDTEKGNANLTYPIGLLTTAEQNLIGNYTANATGAPYWSSLPQTSIDGTSVKCVKANGNWFDSYGVQNLFGVRPSISLKPGTKFIEGGDGTASNPYEVDTDN